MPCDASLSRFGVLPDIMPWLYAPILNQPTSSPMMTIIFGFDVVLVLGKTGLVGVAVSAGAISNVAPVFINPKGIFKYTKVPHGVVNAVLAWPLG